MAAMDDHDVRWVPSQTPIPALQELIREAERDKNARQLSLSDHYSVPAIVTRTTPLPSAHRKSLAPSARLSQASNTPLEEQPEAVAFVELLKGTFERVDEKALKKQREAARTKEKQRGHPPARTCNGIGPRPLTKTSSASAVCPPSKTSVPFTHPDSHGRALAKTASLGLRGDIASGKSTPPSLSSHSLNPQPASAPQLPVRAFTPSNSRSVIVRRPNAPVEGDSPMQDVIDLTETDTDWEQPITSLYTKVDDDDSDLGMDVSFFRPETPPPTRSPSLVPKSQLPKPSIASHPPPLLIQRTRTGPPLLGMRRPSHLPPSQYSSTQGTKGVTVPRFKPPLLTNTISASFKSATVTKPATTTTSRPSSRAAATEPAVVPKAAQHSGDPDSSFDVSFDVDMDALEETMKAYD